MGRIPKGFGERKELFVDKVEEVKVCGAFDRSVYAAPGIDLVPSRAKILAYSSCRSLDNAWSVLLS
jgi:hypothetical protein